ncbi:hypothetical protein BS50DRAFT_588403 [Corynespora cassiicola Philippines]|uniref:Uncharacterized protein n=1 Tax=Corynespora cassiicola Philippines TaxID=1448308 RepID=A0A2T2NPS6_CORCC|nr:hypothetical protein BS50DRAFT_588403 [Corynespora cassiicola Philippines]
MPAGTATRTPASLSANPLVLADPAPPYATTSEQTTMADGTPPHSMRGAALGASAIRGAARCPGAQAAPKGLAREQQAARPPRYALRRPLAPMSKLHLDTAGS